MSLLEIVRKVFPDADEKHAEFLLWNHTSYPTFPSGSNPERYLLNSLRKYKRVTYAGYQACVFCNGKVKKANQIECIRCSRALQKASQGN